MILSHDSKTVAQQIREEEARKAASGFSPGQVKAVAAREFKKAVAKEMRSRAAIVADRMEKAALKAQKKVESLAQSTNEEIATRNAHFILDHVLGKPLQKSISRIERVNIDVVAD